MKYILYYCFVHFNCYTNDEMFLFSISIIFISSVLTETIIHINSLHCTSIKFARKIRAVLHQRCRRGHGLKHEDKQAENQTYLLLCFLLCCLLSLFVSVLLICASSVLFLEQISASNCKFLIMTARLDQFPSNIHCNTFVKNNMRLVRGLVSDLTHTQKIAHQVLHCLTIGYIQPLAWSENKSNLEKSSEDNNLFPILNPSTLYITI